MRLFGQFHNGVLRSSHSSGPTPCGILMYRTGKCCYPYIRTS
jgi:hypothetical protein